MLVVAWAEFSYRRVQDEALLSLQNVATVNPEYSLGRVVGLYIGGPGFDNAHLAELQEFPWLAALDLDFTGVSDDGIANLKGLPRLRTLWIGMNEISDQGLANLSQLPNIEWLRVTTDGVASDDLLKQLTVLRKLQYLTLVGHEIDPNVLQYLRQELPGCQISIESPVEIPVNDQ